MYDQLWVTFKLSEWLNVQVVILLVLACDLAVNSYRGPELSHLTVKHGPLRHLYTPDYAMNRYR